MVACVLDGSGRAGGLRALAGGRAPAARPRTPVPMPDNPRNIRRPERAGVHRRHPAKAAREGVGSNSTGLRKSRCGLRSWCCRTKRGLLRSCRCIQQFATAWMRGWRLADETHGVVPWRRPRLPKEPPCPTYNDVSSPWRKAARPHPLASERALALPCQSPRIRPRIGVRMLMERRCEVTGSHGLGFRISDRQEPSLAPLWRNESSAVSRAPPFFYSPPPWWLPFRRHRPAGDARH